MSEHLETLGDGQLVKRTLQGDHMAFGCLYDRHARRVRAIVRNIGSDLSAVDDLTQESFLRSYLKLDQLHPQENFGQWLMGIARLVAREKRRSLYRDRHRFVGTTASNDQEELAIVVSKSSLGDLQDDLDMVLERVRQLPESQRVAIELFFLEECNAEKTAELLGMSRSGVYVLLKRACRNVAKSIDRKTPVRE